MATWWIKKPQPFCFRGFHIQEIIDVALAHNVCLVPVEPCPVSNDRVVVLKKIRFGDHMRKYPGIVVGETHAVAWDTQWFYDPKDGKKKRSIDFKIRELWIALGAIAPPL